jgi:hypothetical protein
VHDDGKPSRECDPRLSQAASLGDLERPAFQRNVWRVRVRIELAAS